MNETNENRQRGKDNNIDRMELSFKDLRLRGSGAPHRLLCFVGFSAQTHRGNSQVWYKDIAHGTNGENIEEQQIAGSRGAGGQPNTDFKAHTGGAHAQHP
eukprot:1139999-Heterocapsa_arctica.AAC.1